MRIIVLISLFVCSSILLHAQTACDSAASKWSGAASVYYYFIPGEKIPPTITAYTDHKSIHIESRFNYEDKNSLSVFAGWCFEKQYNKLDISITPMAGVVVGHTNGILPGLELNATYKSFTLYSENEYVLDVKGRENYFFYSWSQLSAQIFKNIQVGVLAQSLRWYKTKFDFQRGVYIEYNIGSLSFDAYYFNLFTNSDFAIVSANFNF
jgi:hypothetical protein